MAAACPLVLGGCDAGQQAETARETPDVAGVDGTVGEVSLDDVFLDAEDTVEAGASVPLRGVLTNDAEQADLLVGVSTPAAGSVQLLDESGAPSADGIELPAGGQVEAVSGAVRMQLEGVTAPIAPTDTVPVTFTLATAGEVTLDVPVAPGPGPVDQGCSAGTSGGGRGSCGGPRPGRGAAPRPALRPAVPRGSG